MSQSQVLSILHREYVELCNQLEAAEAAGLPVIELSRKVAVALAEFKGAEQRIGGRQLNAILQPERSGDSLWA